MGPQFTPRQIGTTWKDPKTGQMWKYTKNGWQKESKDIQQEVKSKGTFEVNPDEEVLIESLRAGGSNQEQIEIGLAERRRVLSNMESQRKINPGVATDMEKDPSNPFSGMTKQQVLRDAFNKGVTDVGELEKLESLYDKLVGEEEFTDYSKLAPEQQEAAKESLKRQVALKAQELGSATERESVLGTLATFETGQEIINTLNRGDVKTGFFTGGIRRGVFGVGTRAFGGTTKEEDYFNALTETFAANFRKAFSGVSVNPEEMRRLEQFLPSETKTAQANIEGVRALSDYLSEKATFMVDTDLEPLKPREKDEEEDPLNIFGGGSTENPLGI